MQYEITRLRWGKSYTWMTSPRNAYLEQLRVYAGTSYKASAGTNTHWKYNYYQKSNVYLKRFFAVMILLEGLIINVLSVTMSPNDTHRIQATHVPHIEHCDILWQFVCRKFCKWYNLNFPYIAFELMYITVLEIFGFMSS